MKNFQKSQENTLLTRLSKFSDQNSVNLLKIDQTMGSFTNISRNFSEHLFSGTPVTKDVFRNLSNKFDPLKKPFLALSLPSHLVIFLFVYWKLT